LDAVRRVTKWGPPMVKGVKRFITGEMRDITPLMYNSFMMIHTLYYYDMYQINELLSKNPNSRILALVNYAPEQTGTLYGELNFSKSDGITTQHSPNGEMYKHPDIDKWFQCNSFRGATEQLGCGISWTSTSIGGPLHIITITSCPWELARRHSYNPPAAPTLVVARGATYFGMVRFGDTTVQLRISNHGLASELRHWMVMRDRSNPQTFLDLCVKARRVSSQDLVTGVRAHSVADGHLGDHIIYAYLVDAPGELEVLEGVKLLRGSLLAPHSEALRFDGKDKTLGFISSTWFYQYVVGRPTPVDSLKGRTKRKTGLLQQTHVPSGGLLATKRT